MSNALASYVEKYILNPSATLRSCVDEGNEETTAKLTEKIEGNEGASGAITSASKLRIQAAELLGDKDPCYKGKKTSRKDIKRSTESVSYDPDLAKFCLLEEESNEEGSGSDSCDEDSNVSEEEVDSDIEESASASTSKKKPPQYKKESEDYNYLNFAAEEDGEDDENESDEDEEESELDDDDENDGEGEEEDSSSEEEDEGNDAEKEVEDEESEFLNGKQEEKYSSIATFSSEDSDQVQRALAVKNQCAIFDSLFETRIGLQKVSSIACRLPQFDTYQEFLRNKNYPQYKTNLLTARKAVKKLIGQILHIQETLLADNSETENILHSLREDSAIGSDESFSSDEDVSKTDTDKSQRGSKRKVEQFEENLRKRHKAMSPFCDETLNKWHEKAKLLVSQSKGNFSSFEIPPTQQIANLLANKKELLKKTQLVGVSRGNVGHILGKNSKNTSLLGEEFDPEIFDDTDFYSRMLEDVLKSKMSVSEDMTEVSRKWIDIQNLRKKAKKRVDTKASKGKKIRFQVLSKLQQFLAPCKPSLMDDDSTNKLFSSLFGNSSQRYPGATKNK